MKRRRIILNYIAIASFILFWWLFGFTTNHPVLIQQENKSKIGLPFSSFDHKSDFFSIDHNLLKRALAGDVNQMSELMSKWDIDAQILQTKGYEKIERLSSSDLLRSHELVRKISRLTKENKNIRLLPQTFAAASLLLAIAPIEQIVALPKYLRQQIILFSKDLTDKISLDIDRCHGEKLYLAKPDIAIVAEYSHPATLLAFQNQGIQLYMMRDLTSFGTLENELMNLGRMTTCSDQAEMLKIFMNSALIAIDNRQQLIIDRYEKNKTTIPSVLVLNYHNSFSLPSNDTLNGKILERLQKFGLENLKKNVNSHLTLDKEQLILLNPSCMIVVTSDKAGLENEMCNDEALRSLDALKNGKVFFVDEAIHHSPTQYAVLAYSDLVNIIDKKL